MTHYNLNELKLGMKVMIDQNPYTVLENEYIKPGKGQAFNRLKLRNLKNGRVIERTLKSGDSLVAADIVEIEVHYLYNDGQVWHFMAPDTFEQYAVSGSAIAEARQWLKEQATCQLTLFNGMPLTVIPPMFVVLRVTETDPGLRGDTSGGGSKLATVETGVSLRVPLFIQLDELIKVDTRTGTYLARG